VLTTRFFKIAAFLQHFIKSLKSSLEVKLRILVIEKINLFYVNITMDTTDSEAMGDKMKQVLLREGL
jgi:hypothetical protein